MTIKVSEYQADIFSIIDGHPNMSVKEIKEKMVLKGWKPAQVEIPRLFNQCLDAARRALGIDRVETKPTKPENKKELKKLRW